MGPRAFEREVELFRQHGGVVRMSEALRLGIDRKTLYAMRDAGVVEPVARGLFRLASLLRSRARGRASLRSRARGRASTGMSFFEGELLLPGKRHSQGARP